MQSVRSWVRGTCSVRLPDNETVLAVLRRANQMKTRQLSLSTPRSYVHKIVRATRRNTTVVARGRQATSDRQECVRASLSNKHAAVCQRLKQPRENFQRDATGECDGFRM